MGIKPEEMLKQDPKAVAAQGNDQPRSAESQAQQPVGREGLPQTIPVITPNNPTKLIFAIEQCLDAYTHLTGGGEDSSMAKEDALEYIFNRHYGREK